MAERTEISAVWGLASIAFVLVLACLWLFVVESYAGVFMDTAVTQFLCLDGPAAAPARIAIA